MSESNVFRRFALAGSILALCASFSFAQQNPQKPEPSQKPQNVKKEPDPYGKWITEEASYILTPEEVAAFKKLKTNEERENFISWVWKRRDPNPDTEENEYKDAFYERVAYANEHFTSGIPGWKTERGKIYIKWGKPDGVEAHPSGGSYDRPSYEGGGSTTTYPFETWFYRHLDGIGDGIEIEFVDPTGTGEYRIARDANEKDALATIRGTTNTQNFQRTQDSPFERLRITTDMDRAPKIGFDDLAALAGAGSGEIIEQDPLEFDLRVDFFRQSDDRVSTAFTIQTGNKELSFKDNGGIQTSTMNIFGRITAVAGNKAGIFEDVVTTNATAQDLAEVKNHKSVYQNIATLRPGTYKITVAIRDVESGKIGKVSKGFTVPRYDAEKLSTSTLVLASQLYETTEKDIGGSFIIGDKKVIPNLAAVYKKGQEVGVYLQIYNSGIDQTTLRPSVDVEYVLFKNGKEIHKQPENWDRLSDSGQRLTLARLLPTDRMEPGNYEIKIRIHDKVSNQLLEPTEKFSIIQ